MSDKPKETLDDIIDRHASSFEEAQELFDHYGGCYCCALAGRGGMPPCSFCTEYDWEEDPLELL